MDSKPNKKKDYQQDQLFYLFSAKKAKFVASITESTLLTPDKNKRLKKVIMKKYLYEHEKLINKIIQGFILISDLSNDLIWIIY